MRLPFGRISLLLALLGCGSLEPPATPDVALLPAEPTTLDDLVAVVTPEATGPAPASVVYRFAWSLDGVPVPDLGGATVPAERTARDQRWSVVVTPTEQGLEGLPAQASVTVQNSAPTVSVRVEPAEPTTEDVLTVEVVADDVDGDDITLAIRWSADDGGPILDAPEVPADRTRRGQRWEVRATATDAAGAVSIAEDVAVIGNAPPRVIGVGLLPQEPFVTEDLIAEVEVVDPDGDEVDLRFAWRVDDVGVAASDSVVLPAFSFAKHQRVRVEVVPFDGLDEGTPLLSDPVVVRNSPPTSPGIAVSPERPVAGGELVCAVTEPSFDADGDPLTYRFDWWVDGEPFDAAIHTSEQSLVPVDVTRGGQAWSCEVAADDGEDRSAATSASVEIGWATQRMGLGELHSCVVDDDGDLYCWGGNGNGQLGDGSFSTRLRPTRVGAEEEWAEVAARNLHTCGWTAGRELRCWGWNGRAQLGDGTLTSRSTPTAAVTDVAWSSISAGWYHGFGLSTDGGLYGWGWNGRAQLGDGTLTDRLVPTRIGEADDWTQVSAGYLHTCAVNASSELYCWGTNSNFQLGDGTASMRTSPVRIGADAAWSTVAAGLHHTCALTDEGEAWCWGINPNGEVGDGTTTAQSRPARVNTDDRWVTLAAGHLHTCGLRVDGAIACWGANRDGQLGDGTTDARSTPARVGSSTDWIELATGDHHTCARARDGAIWCWGRNSNGQLGDGTTTQRENPTRVSW